MIYLTLVLIFTLIHAKLDAIKILRHEYIDHFWRTTIWFFACILPIPFIESFDFYFVYAIMSAIIIRIGFYDFSLNKFRKLPWSYTSTMTGSFWDKFEQKYNIDENIVRWSGLILSILLFIFSIIKGIC